MNAPMHLPADNAAHPVMLVLADISGYTRFMIAHRECLVHAQLVVTQLTEAVVEQAQIPLVVAKLEGDAVFLVAVKEKERGWSDDPKALGEQLLAFFDAFQDRLAQLEVDNACGCGACKNMHELRLKVVAHSGQAVFYSQRGFTELAGPDVILAHKLLKNSIPASEYLLLTDAARKDLTLPEGALRRGTEQVEDMGQVTTWVHMPSEPLAEAARPDKTPFVTRILAESRKLTWVLSAMVGVTRPLSFRNLPRVD